ncbi:MAG: hypothetical protein ABS69_08040 [Nitrosomonadales bacterium SCN 54-20]|nr:MAG: hypothetical protein ABS69_08040 [Nitrosomonadales bacterium SCN 54-20]
MQPGMGLFSDQLDNSHFDNMPGIERENSPFQLMQEAANCRTSATLLLFNGTKPQRSDRKFSGTRKSIAGAAGVLERTRFLSPEMSGAGLTGAAVL